MKRTNQIVLTILAVSILSGCDFLKNTFTYKDKTKAFVETILNEDYDKALDHFAMQHELAKNADPELLKQGLANFRETLMLDFGRELNYTFLKAHKQFSTNEKENMPPNTTLALIEFYNDKEFGVFKVLFDDVSGKILNINFMDVKKPIPSMWLFWVLGIVALSVPVFIIYMIIQIKRSNLRRKWLKYIAVIFLNFPSISYIVSKGISLQLLHFQFLFGIGFGFAGYSNTHWIVGIPLGGLYWFWKLRQRKADAIDEDISTDPDLEVEPIIDIVKPSTE